MAVKALIFGTDDLYPQLKPYYDLEIQRGNLEIVGYVVLENGNWKLYQTQSGGGDFQIAIISSEQTFYERMKFIENQGVPRKDIIDGRVFQIPGFNFKRLVTESVGYGAINGNIFADGTYTIYPRIYRHVNNISSIKLGAKSYMGRSVIEGSNYRISVGNFSAISWNITFEIFANLDHHHERAMSYGLSHIDWYTGDEFTNAMKKCCSIEFGNDVWCGRGCFFKCSSVDKPLKIGDGAVIAADSVIVKDVPPYAMVGGNPAKFIKWRFPENIIEAMLRIKWWNWDIDKIHENFEHFKNIEEFVKIHDK